MILVITIIFCVLIVREVLSLIRDNKRQKESLAMSREVKRIRNEWNETEATIRESTRRQEEIEREMRRQARDAERERVRQMAQLEREQARQAKEQERLAQEQAKQAEQIAKHEKRISDLETRMSQAEFDIQREIENLNHYTEKLSKLDEDLRHAEWEIESWQKQRHLANATKAETKADKIRDNIFSIENKVRLAEKRLDKAQRTKDFCEMQMSA